MQALNLNSMIACGLCGELDKPEQTSSSACTSSTFLSHQGCTVDGVAVVLHLPCWLEASGQLYEGPDHRHWRLVLCQTSSKLGAREAHCVALQLL